MSLNWRAIRAIIVKDLKQVVQNKMVWVPMIILPIIMLVILPLFTVLLPTLLPTGDADIEEVMTLLDKAPAALRAPLASLTPLQAYVFIAGNYMFAPMFLIVPLMVASILAADSFTGEKERKTLEALLYTPVSDLELLVGKVLTALVPALVIDVLSFALYATVVNAAGYHTMQRLFFPAPTWWPLVFWLAPGLITAGLGATVLVSSKSKSFVQTQQVSGALVLPVVFLMIGQVTGLFFLSPGVVVLVGAAVWLLGLVLVWIGARTFSRGELIARI
jgi:ABC-2 type transport system permease protein